MTAGRLARLTSCVLGVAIAGPAQGAAGSPPTWLEGARGAGTWLLRVAVPTEHGLVWAADPATDPAPSFDLYHGTAGVVPFLFALAEATGDQRFGEAARSAASALRCRLEEPGAPALAPGLYTGWSGIGAALLVAHQQTGEESYRQGVERVVRELLARVEPQPRGQRLAPLADVVAGNAGIGLFMLRARTALDPELAGRATAATIQLARHLMATAEPAAGGLRWRIEPGAANHYPNFSHGTAGVAYFLIELAAATGDAGVREAALAGGRHLITIAETAGDACLVYHHDPGGERLHYLSWCHGPAGTARLFHRLGQVSGDRSWFEWRRRAARALLRSGIPERRTPGFWNNVGRCCGSAGVIEFLAGLSRHDPRPRYRALADRLAADLLARATREPGGGLRFPHAEHRAQPELQQAQTGLMQGAAGIGLALLELWALESGAPRPAQPLPDSPW